MGHFWFVDKDNSVVGHGSYDDYCFRFLWYTVYFHRYLGPSVYIEFSYPISTFQWSCFYYDFKNTKGLKKLLTLKQLFEFEFKDCEHLVQCPGRFHIIWPVWNRWYKKNLAGRD